jgi:hypothetical protein
MATSNVIATVDDADAQVIIGFEGDSGIRAAVAVDHDDDLSLEDHQALVDELRDPISDVLDGDLP